MSLLNNFPEWRASLKKNKWKILIALFFLVIAVIFFWQAGDWVSDHSWSSVPDIILDHFGPYNLSFIFIWLFAIVVLVFIFYPFIFTHERFHYVLAMLALFLIARSVFMLFTHIGAPVDAVKVDAPGALQFLTFSNDLFFSGHTGLPFLGFLIFRKNKKLRYFMLASSIILAVTVLLMHVHYTIDVLSAFFITYGLYKIGNSFLK